MICLALALSYAERLIPLQFWIPLPGVKLGLANIVTLLALYLLGPGSAFTVLVLRCALGAFFGGGVTGFLFSVTGGVLAMAMMTGAKHIKALSVYGVSILGAAFHNVGQICIAALLMQSVYVVMYLPYLLGISVVTGLLTGTACAGTMRGLYAIRKNSKGAMV